MTIEDTQVRQEIDRILQKILPVNLAALEARHLITDAMASPDRVALTLTARAPHRAGFRLLFDRSSETLISNETLPPETPALDGAGWAALDRALRARQTLIMVGAGSQTVRSIPVGAGAIVLRPGWGPMRWLRPRPIGVQFGRQGVCYTNAFRAPHRSGDEPAWFAIGVDVELEEVIWACWPQLFGEEGRLISPRELAFLDQHLTAQDNPLLRGGFQEFIEKNTVRMEMASRQYRFDVLTEETSERVVFTLDLDAGTLTLQD